MSGDADALAEGGLRKMQETQPWTAPYSEAFYASKEGEPHRSLTHDLLHVAKAVGILASISEWADHGSVRVERVDQAEYEGRIADLVMCALHMANNPPAGYAEFDLQEAVISRVERVNDADWRTVLASEPFRAALADAWATESRDAKREARRADTRHPHSVTNIGGRR